MDYQNIKKIMEDMCNSKLTALEIDFPDGTRISMKKDAAKDDAESAKETIAVKEVKETNNEVKNNAEKINRKTIKSPMVGTFYLKPSPTSQPYVEVGKNVEIGDTVCIIEAMKLMNEIEADISGKIVEILVKDGEPVEYGMPLFAIE